MKPKTKNIISVIILIVIVALFFYYIPEHILDFKQLSLVNPSYLIILIILFTFNCFIIGLITRILVRPLGVKLEGLEAFGTAIITGFYNLITPFRGGMVARAVYLKKKHKFPYTDFLATLSASYILIFLVASFLGILATLGIYHNTGVFSYFIFLIFLCIFLPLLLIIIFSPKLPESKNKWLNRFVKVINGWHLIKNNKKIIFMTSFLTLMQLIIFSFMLYLQFRVFGIEIGFIKCIFLGAIWFLSLLISITPANLGIMEAVTIFSAATIGIIVTESLPAILLGRVVSFLVLFTLGPIFSYILLKHKSNKKNETNP